MNKETTTFLVKKANTIETNGGSTVHILDQPKVLILNKITFANKLLFI